MPQDRLWYLRELRVNFRSILSAVRLLAEHNISSTLGKEQALDHVNT
jgi:hypothetical protein